MSSKRNCMIDSIFETGFGRAFNGSRSCYATLCQQLTGLLHIGGNLCFQRFDVGEALLTTQMGDKINDEFFPIEIERCVQQVYLDQTLSSLEGRAYTDIDYTIIDDRCRACVTLLPTFSHCAFSNIYTHGIHTICWQEAMGVGAQIGRREAQQASTLVAMNHDAAKGERMPKQSGRFFYIPLTY